MVRRRRSGLTLIELIVVLVILVGLAGIIIPMIPSMLGKVHTSAGATNMVETDKWIEMYNQSYFGYPNGWDSITDGKDVISYLPLGDNGKTVSGQLTADKLSADEAKALKGIGIVNVHYLQTAMPDSPTFNPYADKSTDPTPTTLDDKTVLAFLQPSVAHEQLGVSGSAKARYIALGIGVRCTMIGNTAAEPPVLFSDQAELNPALRYTRFAAIFQVADKDGAPRARFVGTLHIAQEGLHGVNAHLQEYYDAAKPQ